MRGRSFAWLLAGVAMLLAGCGDPEAPANLATITVWAHDGDTNYRGILAEVLQAGLADTTRTDGKVSFVLAPGDYTVRVHNTSSTLPPYFDNHVNVRRGDIALVDADYCWTCE